DCDPDGRDECWADEDMDGVGVLIVVQDSGAPGCRTADGEAAFVDPDFQDCADDDDERYPGKTLTQADIDNGKDNDCDPDGRDECWADEDMDGVGVLIVVQDSGAPGCRTADGEA